MSLHDIVSPLAAWAGFVVISSCCFAAEPPALRKTLNDQHAVGTDLWIYNNLQEGLAEARKTNKPLFVTFRCVPCKNCSGFDATVAKGSERIQRLALEKFVAVRQVEMKGVDLSQFQFDYDLNWAAMFINADGTVYARYGTQSAEGADAYNSTEGLEKTMRRVLELHAGYPGNAAQLKGKRGPRKSYRTALEMPGLAKKEQRRGATTRSNCIHCHNIHDAEQAHARATGAFSHDLLWRYPLPDNVGLSIDAADGARVKSVEPGSPAALAGLQAGETVLRIDGQAITSIADMQWALHNLPNSPGAVTVQGSDSGERTLKLASGWKESDISWRGSMWSLPPNLGIWMPPATAQQLRANGLQDDQSALWVKWINGKAAGGRAAKAAGLREGDLIVSVDGQARELTHRQVSAHVKLHHKVGDKISLVVMRNGQRREVTLELVE